MRIAIAADHNGVALKATLIGRLAAAGPRARRPRQRTATEWWTTRRCAPRSAGRSSAGRPTGASWSAAAGSGEQMACNKMRGIRAGLCHDLFTTEIARAHNDANVLVLGAKVVAPGAGGR